MAAQVLLPVAPTVPEISPGVIAIPSDFQIQAQDGKLENEPKALGKIAPPPLGVLSNFKGTFAGTGLNMIFRPNSGQTTFPNPLPSPPPPNPPNENVLELNLTSEKLSFSQTLGSVPNRGLEKQTDIFLNGVPYVQIISDVSNPVTGKGDGVASGIHFEPGLWMHIPATTIDPVLGESLTRMASIPHGTTINAQCLEPSASSNGPPPFATLPAVDITPFVIGNPGKKIPFASQTASATNTPRLPQDLTKFIEAGTITQAILDNPNIVLGNAIEGQDITRTTVFTVSTTATAPEIGGGTANIAFLQGSSVGTQSGPNASAVQMSATFWIEEVQNTLEVPVFTPGLEPLLIQVPAASPGSHLGPIFKVVPPHELTAPKMITVTSTQIQYMQTVFLNFAGLTWPHVSCATLIPTAHLPVPASAFN